MKLVNSQQAPAPEDSRSYEEVMAAENLSTLSGNDLYWMLRLVATNASDQNDFCDRLSGLLNQRLGQNNLSTVTFNGDFWYPGDHQLYPNFVTWSGGRGILPGNFGQNNSVGTLVWWW